MNAPAPIDVSRLKGILKGAKDVMNKVETGDFSSGNIDTSNMVDGNSLVEGAGQQGYATQQNTQAVAPQMRGGQPMYANMANSKLPDAVKQAMMEQPIAQMSGPNHTFNLEDVLDEGEKPMPTMQQQAQQRMQQAPAPQPAPQYRQPMQENVISNGNTFTVSEAALRGIVKDVLLEFMTDTFTKSLSEEVIKKTMTTLIKEGKLAVKKKTTPRK